MDLSAPKTITFVIAVIIAVLAVLAALNALTFIPIASVWLMTIAFIVLAAGCGSRECSGDTDSDARGRKGAGKMSRWRCIGHQAIQGLEAADIDQSALAETIMIGDDDRAGGARQNGERRIPLRPDYSH